MDKLNNGNPDRELSTPSVSLDQENAPNEPGESQYDALAAMVAAHEETASTNDKSPSLDDWELTREQIESRGALAEVRKQELVNASLNADRYLRIGWELFIALMLIAITGFQDVLLWSVGKGALQFLKYPLLVDLVIGENFLQIVGLAYIVVHYLFPTPEKIATAIEERLAKSKSGVKSKEPDDDKN